MVHNQSTISTAMSKQEIAYGVQSTVLTNGMNRLSFSALAEWQPNFPPSRPKIATLLQLSEDRVSEYVQAVFELVDGDDAPETTSDLLKGVRAFTEFQDIFPVTLSGEDAVAGLDGLACRHYCYFEALVYLHESLTCWVQGNDLAAIALLRPFMELSLLHLYWSLKCEPTSYQEYYSWLQGKAAKPNFKEMLEFVLSNLPTVACLPDGRLDMMKQVLQHLYKSLCAYNHTPKPEESIFGMGGGRGESNLEMLIYYAALAEALIRQLVHLYLFAYPMMLFPVDRLRKWGYGGPIGLFADKSNANILRDYIGDNFDKLATSFQHVSHVEDLLSWANNHEDLSDSEIEEDWERQKETKTTDIDKEGRVALCKAHSRSLAWFINYMNVKPKDDEVPDDFVERAQAKLRNI